MQKRIANGISDDITNLFDKIRSQDYSGIHSDRPWVITAPCLCLENTAYFREVAGKDRTDGKQKYIFYYDLWGSIGNAGRYLKALCGKKGMNYLGCYGIVMPENYIAMFSTPAREEAFRTIEKAEGEIDRAIGLIKNSKAFSEPQITLGDKMNSGIVNSIFYPLFVHAKKFYATDACIACGKCERSVRPRISALKTASLYGERLYALHGLYLPLPQRGD